MSREQIALEAIENDHEIIYDVAANYGQLVDNVKYMTWFRKAVEDEIFAGDVQN